MTNLINNINNIKINVIYDVDYNCSIDTDNVMTDTVIFNVNSNNIAIASTMYFNDAHYSTPSKTYTTIFYNNAKMFDFINNTNDNFITYLIAMFNLINYNIDINIIDAIIYEMLYHKYENHINSVLYILHARIDAEPILKMFGMTVAF